MGVRRLGVVLGAEVRGVDLSQPLDATAMNCIRNACFEGKPSDYFRDQGFIGVEAEEAMLPHVAERFGSGKLIFASDYPHWDASSDPVGEFFEIWGETLPAGDQQNILCDTAASLYGLDLSWIAG